ncbi:hypothetical protein [Ekhidna sp.]
MNKLPFILLLGFLGILRASFGQEKVILRISSLEEEVDYIWQNIQDIQFFEEKGYQVVFPKLKYIDLLKEKSEDAELSSNDYERLKSLFTDSIYKSVDYLAGLEKMKQNQSLIEKMIGMLGQLELDWNFKIHQPYVVKLTLYGPGGSYNPDTGHIVLFTTTEGGFKQYENPACTIIHEIVHMGVEQSLIQKLRIPHTSKERIVDQFVLLNFQNLIPSYQLQDMGDYRADAFMNSLDDLKDLDQKIKDALGE